MINEYNPRDTVDKTKVGEQGRSGEGGAFLAPQMLLCDIYFFVAVTNTWAKKQIKERKIYFAFQRFQFMVGCLHCL